MNHELIVSQPLVYPHPFRCLLDELKDKTRILVTHQTQYLKHVDKIVKMKDVRYQLSFTTNYK